MQEQIGMNELKCGETAVVCELSCEGSIRRRLLEIGLMPRTVVCCVGKSPFGDPAAYEIRGAVMAIRNADAKKIRVERKEKKEGADDGMA